MNRKIVKVYINNMLFWKRAVPEYFNYIAIEVCEEFSGTRQGGDMLIGAEYIMCKKFDIEIVECPNGHVAYLISDEVKWIDGSPYLQKQKNKKIKLAADVADENS